MVTEGVLAANGALNADTVLAKHDERYMPREVVDALKKQGVWQETTSPDRQHHDGKAMIAELGHFALVLAFGLALIQSTVPFYGALRDDRGLIAVAAPAAITQFLLVGFAFAALIHAYVVSDFSLVTVVENSNSNQPLLYKITGVWGNHEGSMVLWVMILALFGASVAAFGNNLPGKLKALVLAVQAWVASAFLLFILTTSNPFLRMLQPPLEGNDLNPVLQDIGLAIHPPLLYLGYVGCSISFAFAVAALIEGKIDAAWARWVRPWTLAAWMFLTVGIAMGSYWAYYELGWGGYWFWDPVENASLMPWLAATALLHSAVVMEKRDALKIWTILLAILAFSLSLIGTFLVRSGVLTSVHAFASDPTRGIFILVILIAFIGGALALFAFRAGTLTPGGVFAPISREGALILNNLFLTAAAATVVVGTLYPLALEALTGTKISVGAPFFNLTFAPLMSVLLIIVPFGPLLAWKRGDLVAAAQRLVFAFGIAIAAAIVAAALAGSRSALALFGVWLAAWLIAGAVSELAYRVRLGAIPLGDSAHRLIGLPRSALGTAIAHTGLGLTLLGLVCASTWGSELIRSMKPGETADLAGYSITLRDFKTTSQGDYDQTSVRVRDHPRRARRDDHDPGEARVHPPSDHDHRGGDPHHRLLPALSFTRRHRRRRHHHGEGLLQAAGDADLAGRRGHGAGRADVAERPPAEGRRPAARAAGAAAAGRMRAVPRFLAVLALVATALAAVPALAVTPDEMLKDPGAGGARPGAVGGIALPGLPERIDRRFRRRPRPRSSGPHPRAADRRRHRRSGPQLPGRPLRRVHPAEAALQLAHGSVVGGATGRAGAGRHPGFRRVQAPAGGGSAAAPRCRRGGRAEAAPVRPGLTGRSVGKPPETAEKSPNITEV